MQQQYWNQLTQFKYELCYLSAQFAKYITLDRKIKIGLAITSSTAIAAWATWTSLSFFWGFIIALGQVISAVNGMLPYQKRIKELSEMQPRLNAVYILAEKKWYDVANGKLTEEEINELLYIQFMEWGQIDQAYFCEDALPRDEKCTDRAEYEKNIYFERRFGV